MTNTRLAHARNPGDGCIVCRVPSDIAHKLWIIPELRGRFEQSFIGGAVEPDQLLQPLPLVWQHVCA